MELLKYACPILLYIFSILAVFFAFMILCSEDRKDKENKLLIVFCFSSAIWSIGFGTLILQTDPEWAYKCRAFGMIGTIMYLIFGQLLISYVSGIPKRLAAFFDGFASLGVIVYFLTVERSQTIYKLDASGMTYSFKSGPANTIYTVYSLILAVLMLFISIYMWSSKVKRIRYFGKIFLAADAAMLIGTILDTLFPLLGIPAIPGSTLMQFFGVLVVYKAIRADSRSKITISNMSEFIYYSLSMPVLVYNANKQLQIANDAAAKFLNINQEQLLDQNLHLQTHFDIEDESVFDFTGNNNDMDCICKHNQIHCNLAINKIQDRYNDIIGYIIIVTDLSERIKTLQSLEEAKQEAEAANHSKSAFLANMSHEIRTPMNAILGFSELILKLEASDTVQEYAADIKSSCLNLLGIINDILDISKLDSGKAELNCNDYHSASLLQEIYHITDIQAKKKGLQFEMNIDPRVPNKLFGDKTRIRGILINLLSNAVKYTEQGKVTFEIHLVDVKKDNATLEFIVSDTGIGLKDASLENLFDSFARFDTIRNANIEGTGLGLSIVNGYVNLMGGTITVDSVYGEGTTFKVTLKQDIIDDSPIHLTQTSIQDSNTLNAEEFKILDTHVLVTDDNHINLKVIKNTLEYYGLKVDTASSGTEALQLCESTQYDLIFMDQMMPRMDGIETLHRIRQLASYNTVHSKCKVIALTANAILGVREELLEKGFDEYLSKPIQFQELERLLKLFIPKENFTEGNASSAIATEIIPTPEPHLQINATEEVTLEELLPQIDVAGALAYCNNDRAFYTDILHILYDDGAEQLDTLKSLWEEKDWPNFIIHIHSLKTQLLNIGYSSFAEDARALEFAGKESRYEYIDEHLSNFIKDYKMLLNDLEKAFQALK